MSCLICLQETADPALTVFSDDRWAAGVIPGYDVPGWVILRLRRHAEGIGGLGPDELTSFGRRIRDLVGAVREATGAVATYLLSFGEANPHFHVLVAPRTADVPEDRRTGDILKLRFERASLNGARALVTPIRLAYERLNLATPEDPMEPITAHGISMTYHRPALDSGDTPLLVALHGGTYTSAYFGVAGGPMGSFLDIASRNGFAVLTVDRPGYGQSVALTEADNTFARQAEILDSAIGEALAQKAHTKVVLVGHSIGGMVSLEVAARHPRWPLVGVATAGMGARIPSGGAAEQLGSLPLSGVVDLPIPDRDGVMFGPPGSFSPAALAAAHKSYAPTPFVELVNAPRWAKERLRTLAAEIKIPVHNVLAEFDALWDSSAAARAEFVSLFSGNVTSELAAGVGHSIDHHLAGAVLHLQQLAFASACAA